jgi:Flp pilus assembly protein TadD
LLGIRRRVVGPEDPSTLATMHNLAFAINKQGRAEEAETLYRELLDVRRRVLGAEHPDTLKTTHNRAVLYTNRSWTIATTSEVSDRNPAKAVEFASLAVGLAPDDANHWSNLGVAQYRAGNWQGAVEALEKADAMLENGDCVHRMFFAMARWQLGDKQQARELYAQGASWIASRRKESAAQIRFRAEAEQLMGITEEDRQRLVEEYLARQVDQTGASPKEKPNGKPKNEQMETGDQGAKQVEREQQCTEPCPLIPDPRNNPAGEPTPRSMSHRPVPEARTHGPRVRDRRPFDSTARTAT